MTTGALGTFRVMRYPDGGGLTSAERAHREKARLTTAKIDHGAPERLAVLRR